MPTFKLTSPTRLEISDLDSQQRLVLDSTLKYTDKKIEFEIKRLKDNPLWFVMQNGEEAYKEKLEELKVNRNKTLVFEDEKSVWTYPGVLSKIAFNLKNSTLENLVSYPEPDCIPWSTSPFPLREYQKEAVQALLNAKHGAVAMGTGTGKSLCVLYLAKALGLKTVIMTPSLSIADQIYDLFEKSFGGKYVGKFYNSKKEPKKLFVIASGASLTKLEQTDENYKILSSSQVLIVDESHTTPSQTLENVCLNLFKDTPYRFFFSGTQMRNDGLDIVLEGIIGRIVYELTVRQGVDQGFLAKPLFFKVKVRSDSSYFSKDPQKMIRKHIYQNKNINKMAGELANRFVGTMKRPTLILIDEVGQFSKLLPHFKFPAFFAHGGLNKDNKDLVPTEYHKSDPKELVKRFNAGEIPILVGTSCISTGTDVIAVEATINLVGGASEIQVKQGPIGRSTRKGVNPWTLKPKEDCVIVDFDLTNVENLHRHFLIRQEIYNDTYGPVQELGI